MDYLQRLQDLKTILQSFFNKFPSEIKENDYHDMKNQIEEWGKSSSDLGSDLEITFRSIFQEDLLIKLLLNQNNIEDSLPIHFIKFTIDFALLYPNLSNAFSKIPFLLIEDLLEDQTIQYSKKIWKIIESLVDKITTPSLFLKGKFVVLKTCNSLLKKLSKSYDTEFCGRILMFLAAVYPISERSALNLSGKINVANHTYFENKEKYVENVHELNSKEYEVEGKENASAMKVVGEDGEEIDEMNLPFVITYDLYESFWKLQSFFASDFKALDTTTANVWNDFMENAKKVFDILTHSFKSNNKVKTENAHPNGSNHTNNTGGGSIAGNESTQDYFGCKYLTSSQLFSLQLKDPLLRRQIAVQFLFFAHYLKLKALSVVDNETQKQKYEKDLKWIHDQSKSLIETSSSSNGQQEAKNFLEMIQRIFTREEHWISWKNQSCPVFERTSVVADVATSDDATANGGVKRKFDEMESAEEQKSDNKDSITLPSMSVLYDKALKDFENKKKSYLFDLSKDNITDIAKNLSANYPDLNTQIEMYLEADDPEAGIEEEYHPKNDHLYSWRTRRIFAEKHLTYFQYMPDGNLGKGFRKLRNLPEPEPRPVNDTDNNSLSAPTEELSLDLDKVNDDAAMRIEEEGEAGSVKNDDLTVTDIMEEKNEDASTNVIPPSSTKSNQSTKPFAEPEDGEELEEVQGSDETKMET